MVSLNCAVNRSTGKFLKSFLSSIFTSRQNAIYLFDWDLAIRTQSRNRYSIFFYFEQSKYFHNLWWAGQTFSLIHHHEHKNLYEFRKEFRSRNVRFSSPKTEWFVSFEGNHRNNFITSDDFTLLVDCGACGAFEPTEKVNVNESRHSAARMCSAAYRSIGPKSHRCECCPRKIMREWLAVHKFTLSFPIITKL